LELNEEQRPEAEKRLRVALQARGYGYADFYDEMRQQGLTVALHADATSFAVEVLDVDSAGDTTDTIAIARAGRHATRALDRAALQIRAQLEIEDPEPFKGS